MLSWLFWSAGHPVHILCPVHTLGRAVLLLSWFLWALGDWVILTVWRAFSILVCVCVFNSCVLFLAEKGKHIFSLLPLSILLPSILYSSDTATSYFPPVKWDRPLFYQLLLLCHIFVLGSWLLAGSQHTRIHPHSRDDIQTFSSLSFPGLCALYRWQSESSQLSLEVRSDRASECKNRGQSEGVWGTQWVTYFMSVFLLSADFCIWTYFCIFLKELFKW